MTDLPPNQSPPSYSHPDSALLDDFDVPIPDDILPDYSERTTSAQPGSAPPGRRAPAARPSTKEFQYKVEAIKGPPIAVLTVLADALYSQSMPTFVGVGPIKGTVRLGADKVDGVRSILLSVTGRFISGIEDEQAPFLELSTTIYSQGTETPQAQDGGYLWPFEFKIATELNLVLKKGGEAVRFAPPQTFAERTIRGSVRYDVGMKIKRGMLRPDYKISATFGYIPLIRPPPFPLLRSLAYEQRTPLAGPENDHEGWHALDAVRTKGPPSMPSADIEIECTLYMTKPLAYTIGTSIPLVLKLTVPRDAQHTFDELVTIPNSITVRLRRNIASYLPTDKLKVPDNLNLVNHTDIKDLYEAVWWVPDQTPLVGRDGKTGEYTRWMHGEIHIGKEVKPSSNMPYFKIEYAVLLLPFSTSESTTAVTKKTQGLREQKVEMVTSFAPGPRPVRYAPPGYTSSVVPADREPFGGFVPPSSGFM